MPVFTGMTDRGLCESYCDYCPSGPMSHRFSNPMLSEPVGLPGGVNAALAISFGPIAAGEHEQHPKQRVENERIGNDLFVGCIRV